MPLRLGDHVFVGESSVVQAATVGSHVRIGAHVVVGEFAITKDYVRVLDGTVIPANMVIPSFSIVAGQPARLAEPEGAPDIEFLGHHRIGRCRHVAAGQIADQHDRATAPHRADCRTKPCRRAGNLECGVNRIGGHHLF